MKKHDFGKPLCRLIMAVAMMMLSHQAMAYDFSYTHQGKTLYYNITSENTVAVTYRRPYYSSSNNYVSGDVVIPTTVIRNGTTYSVTSIGNSAFRGCSGLTSVTIPTGVTSIGKYAFRGCSGLTTLNFNAINCQDFSSNDSTFGTSLTTVNIGDSVQRIPAYFVSGCRRLTSITIPNSVTSIGDGAFYGCSSLTSVTIPTGVTSIGSVAFLGCSSLTSVTLPNSLTSIGEDAFYGCSSLTSVTLGNSVTSIGDHAFRYCSSLTTLNFNALNCQDFSLDNYRYYPFDYTPLTTVNIGDSVQRIPANFVRGCSGLTLVTIPNSVTSIGDNAFYGCSGLTSVTIGNSVTSIGGSAFNGCSGLTSVTIGDRVTSIENSVFRGCTSLDSITIGTGVAYIEQRAFNDCSRLTTLNFNAINCQDFSSDYYYTNFSNTLTTVNIGDSVQRIPAHFVKFCRGLTSVTIPNGVTSIGEKAFEGCSGLTSVTIPNSVTSIGGSAFNGCSGLTSVTIGNSVTSIGGSAFSGCSSLTSVSIPTGVTSIGEYAFSGCSSLTSVTIPTGVTSIGNGAFSGCSGLTSVTIPNSVTSIGGSAFSRCSGLTSVTLPNSLTSISNAAFSGCSGLTSITLPNSVTSIGDRAFYECLNLSSLISLATVPPTIGNEAFPYPNICTVTVPCGSLEAYTASTCYWSVYFPQRITTGFPFELNASANDSTLGTVAITTGESCAEGVLTAIPELCYRFVAWNDGNTTNPRTITLTQDTTLTANFERAVYTQEIHHAICEGSAYTENGFNANEAGTYTQNLQTIDGCDSIVTLTLTVNPVENTNLMAAICEGSAYTENGFNVSEAGTYTQNLQTVNGCDSIVTLTLTVNPVESTTLSAAICEGATYTENGFNVSEAGTYTQNLQTINGCDSIVTLTLTVNPVESTTLSAAICEGATYTENGFNVSEAGTYTQNLQTVNGCDSIVTLTLTVNPAYNITIDASINEGETYEENGFSESEAGTYVHTLQSEFGCDSVITLNLTVNSSLNDVVANAVEVRLYPNPAKSFVTLEFEALKENTLLQILDLNGRRVRTLDLKAGIETLRIDLGDLPKGVYTIMIGNVTKKLIVE